jgi:hypothetical protein
MQDSSNVDDENQLNKNDLDEKHQDFDSITEDRKISRLQLCHEMKESSFSFTDKKEQLVHLRNFILSKLLVSHEEVEDIIPDLDKKIRMFLVNVIKRYKKVKRNFSFLTSKANEDSFLGIEFDLPNSLIEHLQAQNQNRRGRKGTPGNTNIFTFIFLEKQVMLVFDKISSLVTQNY